MKLQPIGLCAALLVLVPLAACGGSEADDPVQPPDAGAEVEVPSQDDLDAEAAKDITEENADEAFNDLKDEIEGDE